MQFAKVQGGGLAALGFLLLALQVYILFSSTRQVRQPHPGSGNSNSGRTDNQVRPRDRRLTGSGCRRVLSPSTKETGQQ
jgi:hypothetical protein